MQGASWKRVRLPRFSQSPTIRTLPRSFNLFHHLTDGLRAGSPIEGRPPDLSSKQTGCAFAARCSSKVSKCKEVSPPLVSVGQRKVACWESLADA
ncbi:oligopeptide/dipeptide ABC transporter ATP-binding protein [Sinorhizobium meliloti]|uniref:oligopeptide/dipeptide ABC transporter ATP-binding protein n=1 Tax=Rhizobium meliloti TaxID=382 RepID=UPI002D219329|nr:oligopeptide/dipeptide ABC transporter ATP-binding protein [Sinorhizobium meliloti]